jgi:competence protein ComEA
VNINTATPAELESLPGIGAILAQRIIDDRTDRGPFQSPDDIKRVRGIGDALYEQIQELITVR